MHQGSPEAGRVVDWRHPSPKHRNSGSLALQQPLMPASAELQAQLTERLARVQHYSMSTPEESPRQGCSRGGSASSPLASRAAASAVPRLSPGCDSADTTASHRSSDKADGWFQLTRQRKLLGAVTVASVSVAIGQVWWGSGTVRGVANDNSKIAEMSAKASFEELYSQKLDGIAASVASLQGLSEVVQRADETYEEVYHNQLVQSGRKPSDPDEADWNSFVREARQTSPAFLEGKERLRDAVANLYRLIRRAPEFMKNMFDALLKRDVEEVNWYLHKLVSLAENVHTSMEASSAKFAEVDVAMDGMTRDARENEEHLEGKVSRLSDEVQMMENSTPMRTGAWEKSADVALSGCLLQSAKISLEGCKEACLNHASGSCDRLTYYKTAMREQCYLHCNSATPGKYAEADTFVLNRAPQELAIDASQKRKSALVASQVQVRWHSVRGPLREVSHLVRRFRSATAELRRGLEEVRFAADDLRAAVEASGQLELIERRVSDVLAAVEDLGNTLKPLGKDSRASP